MTPRAVTRTLRIHGFHNFTADWRDDHCGIIVTAPDDSSATLTAYREALNDAGWSVSQLGTYLFVHGRDSLAQRILS